MKGLFLGAGASYEVGMPLVSELSNMICQLVLHKLNSKLFDFKGNTLLKKIFETLLKDKKLSYEQILEALENKYIGERNKGQDIWNIISQFIECIQLILLEDHGKTLAFFKRKVRDYKGIENLLDGMSPVHVFSLNHDVVFEEICSYFQMPLKDGFYNRESKYRTIANFKTLTKAEIEQGKFDFYKDGECGINLLKLHGAVDLFAVDDKNMFLKSFGDGKEFGSYYNEILKIERHNHATMERHHVRATNELQVYDSENTLQFLRRSLLSGGHKFQGKFGQIVPVEFLKLFQEQLTKIDHLTVIGYGFGDGHINTILNRWMGVGVNKMVIYDPYRFKEPEFLVAYQARIELIQQGLTDFFDSSAPTEKKSKRINRCINAKIRENLKRKRESYKVY